MATRRQVIDKEVQKGLIAYAAKQADIRSRLARSFADDWLQMFELYKVEIPRLWPGAYRTLSVVHKDVSRRRQRTLAYARFVHHNAPSGDAEGL